MAEQVIKTVFQVRRGLFSDWYRVNPILRAGEPSIATDTHSFKVGDGITPWRDLPVTKITRNNLYNYEKTQDTFIPENGEICLVDTPHSGLRVKVGDGKSTFASLEYTDSVLYTGYYADGKFYSDAQKTKELEHNTNKFYIDLASAKIYIYDGSAYMSVSSDVPNATPDVAGIVKLYNESGGNEDGTMTQKSITEEIGKKMSASIDGEIISFQ